MQWLRCYWLIVESGKWTNVLVQSLHGRELWLGVDVNACTLDCHGSTGRLKIQIYCKMLYWYHFLGKRVLYFMAVYDKLQELVSCTIANMCIRLV